MMNRQFVLTLIALSFVACQKLTTVTVSPPSAKIENAGGTVAFSASQLDADGQPMKKSQPVAWSSDNPAIATIDNSGLATARKSGKVAIIAKVGEVQGQASLDVHIPAKILANGQKTAQPLVLSVNVGSSVPFMAEVADDAGTPMPGLASTIMVASADPKVATVAGAPAGPKTIAGIAPGQTKLIVTAADGKVTQSYDLTVKIPDFASIKVDPSELNLKVGEDSKLAATAVAADKPVPGVPFTFSTDDANVASVDPTGSVHAVGKGKATITVKAADKSATVPVAVKK